MGKTRQFLATAGESLFLVWTAVLPIMHPFNLRFAHRYTLPAADFIFVAAALSFFAAVVCGAFRIRWSGWYWALLAYAASLTLATVMAQNVTRSVPKLAGDLYLVVAAAIVFQYAVRAVSMRRIIFAWLTGLALTIAGFGAGLILFATGRTSPRSNSLLSHFGTLPPGHYPRLRGLFLDANMASSYIVTALMIVFAARRAGWISRRAFAMLMWGGTGSALFTISPCLGGLCLGAGLCQYCLDSYSTRGKLALAAGVLAGAAFFGSVMISPTPMGRGASLIETIRLAEPGERVQLWNQSWHTFLGHPWTGLGLEAKVAESHYTMASGVQHTATEAHNTWLSVMAKQGLPGLVAFLAVTLYPIRKLRFAGLKARPDLVYAGLGIAVIAGFYYSNLTVSMENTRHVWALLGLVAGAQEGLRSSELAVLPEESAERSWRARQ